MGYHIHGVAATPHNAMQAVALHDGMAGNFGCHLDGYRALSAMLQGLIPLETDTCRAIACVVIIQVIAFDNGDKFFGIFRVGGISTLLQATRPALVVGGFEGVEPRISLSLEETSMVVPRFYGAGIAAV